MIVGNVAALAQTDIKRLLAYSGIAQVGYIVAAFAGTTSSGLRYAIFYLGAYTFMNLGAFAVVALLSREREEGSRLASFAGLGYRQPALAAAMTFFLLSLAGLAADGRLHRQSAHTREYGRCGVRLARRGADRGYGHLGLCLLQDRPHDVRAFRGRRRSSAASLPATALPWVGVSLCAASRRSCSGSSRSTRATCSRS